MDYLKNNNIYIFNYLLNFKTSYNYIFLNKYYKNYISFWFKYSKFFYFKLRRFISKKKINFNKNLNKHKNFLIFMDKKLFYFYKLNNFLLKSGLKLKSFSFFCKFLNIYCRLFFYNNFFIYFNTFIKKLNFPLIILNKNNIIKIHNLSLIFSKFYSFKFFVKNLLNLYKSKFYYNFLFEFFQVLLNKSKILLYKEMLFKDAFKVQIKKKSKIFNKWAFLKL